MKPRQMALDLAYDPAMGRADFIEGTANAAALHAVENWQGWSGKAMLLVGPPASGKTHLATIWAEAAAAPIIRAHDLSEDLLKALEEGFRLCVDGVDTGPIDETLFFHLFNLLRARGEALLLTARHWPAEWGLTLPDLVSRARAVPVVELNEPDEELLERLLFKLFADRQLDVSPGVVTYLSHRMERSVTFAHRLVEAIDREALARRARVTKPLAGKVLEEVSGGDEAP